MIVDHVTSSCDCDFFVILVIHLIVNVVGAGTVWKRNGKGSEKREKEKNTTHDVMRCLLTGTKHSI